MNLRQSMAGLAMLLGAATVNAQSLSLSNFYVTTGWFHIAPQSGSQPIRETNFAGLPVNIELPGSAASLNDADTLGFTAGYFLTEHIAAEFVLGAPPKFDLDGAASLSQFGKLGEARQWSPTLLLKYYFNLRQSKLRPYLGIGVSRIWFTDAKITNGEFEQDILHGPTSVYTNSAWAPVFNAGLNYNITNHWFASASLSYLPFSVTAKLRTTASSQFGPLVVQSQTRIKVNSIVSYVSVGYRF